MDDEEIMNQTDGADEPMTDEEEHRFDEFEDLRDRIEGLRELVSGVLDAVRALQGIAVESAGVAVVEPADDDEETEVIVPLTELDFFDEIEGD